MVNRALRIRIYPNKTQQKKIDTTINCCRFIRNHMLERNSKVYNRRGEHLNYISMQNLLPQMKRYLPWLKEADAKALQYACRQVDNAYHRFFRKQGGYPKFSSKHDAMQSYTNTNPNTICYEVGRVKIPCIGWVKVRDNRMLPAGSKICQVTVIRDHGEYYASVMYKYEDSCKSVTVCDENVVGLDYKSDGLYVDSNEKCCNMPHYYCKSQKRLKQLQRKLSKRIKTHIIKYGSKHRPIYDCKLSECKNVQRLLKKVARLYEHIANQRKDFLHKQSTAIAKLYDAVCVEDLNMQGLANKKFGNGKATLDNGYGMFLSMLEYKLKDRGKRLVKVDRFFPSSQLCSCCGHKQKIQLNERVYRCTECGIEIDRDYNAAINIKNEGLRILKEKAA